MSKNIQPTLNLKLAKIKQSPEAQSPIRMGKKKKKEAKLQGLTKRGVLWLRMVLLV